MRRVYKGGAWERVGEWLERWEKGWREWRTNKGIVYMWISTRMGECYVGSTKGSMEERARSHLRLARKVRVAWKNRVKIEDEEVKAVHREIAKRPNDWAMIPISGELMNWKRVEKRAIRYFDAKLNTKDKIKKKKENKRNRPLKREKSVEKIKNKIKNKIKRKNKKMITTFKIKDENKKYEDLWDAIKIKNKKITITWKKGEIDVTRWEKIWSEKIIKRVEWKGKEIVKWKGVRKIIKKKKKEEMMIEYERVKEKNKWTEIVEESKKKGWKDMGEKKENELWKMLKGCKGIRKKMARERAKNIIKKEIKKRTGRTIPKRVIVRIGANENTCFG